MLNKQCESQSDPDDNNTDIIKTFISDSSSHHTEIPVTYSELHIPIITKNHSHWQSLLEFSQEQLNVRVLDHGRNNEGSMLNL